MNKKKKENPLITIVTVVLNGEKTIRKTLESITKQTYCKIEYIVIDGHSTDNTLTILNHYKEKITHFLSEKDHGIYDAMNKSLKIATGDYLIFINSGDYLISENTIEWAIDKFSSFNTIYYGDVILINPNKKESQTYGGHFTNFRFCFENICHQAIFYPKDVYKKFSYDLNYPVFADYIYNIRLKSKNIKFYHIKCIISFFDTSGISSYKDDPLRNKKEKKQIIIDNFGMFYYLLYFLKMNLNLIRKAKTLIRKTSNNGCVDYICKL